MPKGKSKDKSESVLKYRGASTYLAKFQSAWTDKWPFILPVDSSPHFFMCTVCTENKFRCSHQGEKDVTRHIASTNHVKLASEMKDQKKINSPIVNQISNKTIETELRVIHAIVKNNVQLAFADPINKIIKKDFADSERAKTYSCGKTKTACILNEALAPYYLNKLI